MVREVDIEKYKLQIIGGSKFLRYKVSRVNMFGGKIEEIFDARIQRFDKPKFYEDVIKVKKRLKDENLYDSIYKHLEIIGFDLTVVRRVEDNIIQTLG